MMKKSLIAFSVIASMACAAIPAFAQDGEFESGPAAHPLNFHELNLIYNSQPTEDFKKIKFPAENGDRFNGLKLLKVEAWEQTSGSLGEDPKDHKPSFNVAFRTHVQYNSGGASNARWLVMGTAYYEVDKQSENYGKIKWINWSNQNAPEGDAARIDNLLHVSSTLDRYNGDGHVSFDGDFMKIVVEGVLNFKTTSPNVQQNFATKMGF